MDGRLLRRIELGQVTQSYARLQQELHREWKRRASPIARRPASKLARTKQNAPDLRSEAFTAPRIHVTGNEDGCSSESA